MARRTSKAFNDGKSMGMTGGTIGGMMIGLSAVHTLPDSVAISVAKFMGAHDVLGMVVGIVLLAITYKARI